MAGGRGRKNDDERDPILICLFL